MGQTDVEWQLVVVDDHSSDDGFSELERLAKADNRIVAVRLARNVGSHMAIICGLEFITGDCAVVMASDLEDPPEVLPQMLEQWEAGRKVGDDTSYNDAATRVMKKHGITINDLNALTDSFPVELFTAPGNVHFKTEGSKKPGQTVAGKILELLGQ